MKKKKKDFPMQSLQWFHVGHVELNCIDQLKAAFFENDFCVSCAS